MSLELCILASGSSGNCSVLRTPSGCVLIDCGIGPRAILSRLADAGLCRGDVRAIVLTHLDSDHFRPAWLKVIAQQGIRLYCHRSIYRQVLAEDRLHRERTPAFARWVHPFDDAFEAVAKVRFTSVALAHDEAGSRGYLIEGFACRIGYATDLGRVTTELIERFRELDLLAIESNYDPHLQRTSGRPRFLQQRIMGGRGHLSNEQCFEAVVRIFDRDEPFGRLPRHVVLLHRSRQCNCPSIVRDLFSADPRLAERLVLAEQYERTKWLCVAPGKSTRFEESLFATPASGV